MYENTFPIKSMFWRRVKRSDAELRENRETESAHKSVATCAWEAWSAASGDGGEEHERRLHASSRRAVKILPGSPGERQSHQSDVIRKLNTISKRRNFLTSRPPITKRHIAAVPTPSASVYGQACSDTAKATGLNVLRFMPDVLRARYDRNHRQEQQIGGRDRSGTIRARISAEM